jgi:hypothetical protein
LQDRRFQVWALPAVGADELVTTTGRPARFKLELRRSL